MKTCRAVPPAHSRNAVRAYTRSGVLDLFYGEREQEQVLPLPASSAISMVAPSRVPTVKASVHHELHVAWFRWLRNQRSRSGWKHRWPESDVSASETLYSGEEDFESSRTAGVAINRARQVVDELYDQLR